MKSRNLLEFIDFDLFETFESLNEFLLDAQILLDDDLPGIHFAAKCGSYDSVVKLLFYEPSLLNSKDKLGQTPLIWASAEGHIEIVSYLLTLGADTSVSTQQLGQKPHNRTSLHWAIINKHSLVVKTLLDFGADSSVRHGALLRHYIHIAAKNGHLNSVKLLLKQNPNCLEYVDSFNKTALMLASAYGHLHVVKYLISKGANLETCTSIHKKKALTLALKNKRYEVANILILAQMNPNDPFAILPFIESGKQAILMMIQEPSLINVIMLNTRVLNLILCEESKDIFFQENAICLYKTRARRPSFYAQINVKNKKVSVFEPIAEVGSGTFGVVRKFQDNENNFIAVKSPVNNLDELPIDKKLEEEKAIVREAQFNNLIYPKADLPRICIFSLFRNQKNKYTYRYIMPFIDGERANIAISNITNVYQLADIVLKIAQELHRIHGLGILHGDIYEKNILIARTEKSFLVQFIDTGFSCFLTDESAEFFVIDNLNENRWFAPEICTTSKDIEMTVKPHTSQDVYSLGVLLNTCLTGHVCLKELHLLFPSTFTFMRKAIDKTPKNRPSLNDFCSKLSEEILQKNNMNEDTIKPSSFFKIT